MIKIAVPFLLLTSICYADYQGKKLLHPSNYDIINENKNQQVYIYSYRSNSDVELAFDTQFDRLEHMMFVNTLPPEGSAEEVEDECD